MTTSNKKNIVLVATITMVLLIGTAVAYFTDKDNAINDFTIGNIDIELNEPNWNAENGKDMTPLKEIAKDPQIENTGANKAYVFAKVTVPTANVKTATADGSLVAAKTQDLFIYTVGADWQQVKKTATDAGTEYIYAYVDDGGKMKTLAKGKTTTPVFESVSLINIVEGQIDNQEVEIKVEAMGIQADDISTKPLEVLSLIENAK